MGVVARRNIDFLILLIRTPLVSVLLLSTLFCSIPTFCSFFLGLLGRSLSEPHLVETMISLSVYIYIKHFEKEPGCCCKKEQVQEE